MEKADVPLSTAALREEPESATREKEVDPTRADSESITTISSSAGEKSAQPAEQHDDGVNISRAEAEFAALNREFSRTSHLSRTKSRQSRKGAATDVEKAVDEDTGSEEPFDLQTVLRGNRDEEERAGIKSKRIGVFFEDLTVSGIGGVKNYVKTFPDAFVSFFNVFATVQGLFGLGKKGREFDILKDFRGVVKPGEMCLVLGRPGSGCTTFLKVISNQRYGYTKVGGKVMYGPFESDFFKKRYRGEAVYCEEDDNHHPTLDVGQTLDFALETKVPGKRPAGVSRKDFKERVIDLMLKMFNIEHTRNTIVGNPFVRGVSGGERKRVSIAEAMVTGAALIAWDNSTRGLDASTAVDYARSLRVLTNIYKTTTFVSLYQASENIYKVFDKVLVIDSGRQVYFGPTKDARAYFEGLGFLQKPRQTSPDYLTGCTDPFEREYKAGRSEKDVPSTPDALAQTYKDSQIAADCNAEIAAYHTQMAEEKEVYDEFMTAVQQSKRHAPKKSVYSIPFYLQVRALFKRQFLLKWQDKFTLVTSWATSIIIAIVIGTVWLDLPTTSDGAFTRGGVLFIALLFNAFNAFSELPGVMLGRPIVNKHRAFTFYRPSALWVAQIGVDLLFSSVQILIFSIIVYFMTGLVRDAGAFFIFVLMVISGYLSMTLFFRTVGCLCPDFDVAIRLAATIITLFVLTSGYIIQYQSEQVWLRWIFYINALGLAFSALMMNEFGRLDLTCAGTSLIPNGPGYGDINSQVCTLPGSQAGSTSVSGSDYIRIGFSYLTSDLWRNWGIIVVLIVAFLTANVFLGEYIKWGAGGRTVTFFLKENKELQELNEKLRLKRDRRNRKEADTDASSGLKITSKAVLTWEDLCYDVPVPSGELRLLNNIYGYVKPGQLTALMGASGAGKTTLLDVLAARKNVGVIGGEKLVDGQAPGIAFQRGTAYAEQLDVHVSLFL